MSTERLKEQVKVRVPRDVKRGLELIAANRHLEMSDIAREAFRQFLAKNDPAQLELEAANGKKVAA